MSRNRDSTFGKTTLEYLLVAALVVAALTATFVATGTRLDGFFTMLLACLRSVSACST